MSNSNRSIAQRLRRALRIAAVYAWRYGHLLLPLSAAILSFTSTWILFDAVLNRSGDDIYHLTNEYALAHSARVGDNIFGPWGMEYGQPVLRFYQPMFYLINVGIHRLTGWHLTMIHNVATCIYFGLSPFAVYYFFRKLRLNRWTAGFGSYLSMISVAAFGNSFEAFFQAGIVTQSLGGLLFPLFMGKFVGMLRGEDSPVTTGALFSLTFVSHVIMAVYATFGGALYFLLSEINVRKNIKRGAVFAVTGIALVAFWLVPFVHHNSTMRPEPDSVFRGSGVHWYTSVSTSELVTVASRGYMLDDARAKGDARNDDEKFMDRINIMGTLSIRPPVFTILTAIGIFFSLFTLRRLSTRFLLGGLAFSLMLYAGPDDFRWLRFLPFMAQIQAFRCIYLVEIFAFGLSALGVEAVVGTLFTFFRTRRRLWVRIPLLVLLAAPVLAGIGWLGKENRALGQTHLVIQEEASLNQDLDALAKVPNKGYPWRVEVRCEGRPKIRQAWFGMHGFQPYCTHWKGTGPEYSFDLCSALGNPEHNTQLHALAGVRWFTGWGPKGQSMKDAKDTDQLPMLRSIHPGNDRHGRSNHTRVLLDAAFESFLRPLNGQPLLVVCNDKQWLWLAKAWTQQYRNQLHSDRLPIPMRVPAGTLADSEMDDSAAAILYLDHQHLSRDRAALARFAASDVPILSPLDIDGVPVTAIATDEAPLQKLPAHMKPPPSSTNRVRERDEENPVFEQAHIALVPPKRHTFQHFAFDAELLQPMSAVLPMENYPGWKAYLDGREIPVFSTGPNLVGVHLPRGVHRVRFAWEMPARDRAMLWLSIVSALLVVVYWVRRSVRAVRDPRSVPRH